MTEVLYTVDTELSPELFQRGLSAIENLDTAVLGRMSDGTWGIGYQIERLNAHGLKGVFFVEALSTYLFGTDILKRVVDPILEGGHEVQLHLHTEWLRWIEKDLVGSCRGMNIADFAYADQYRLIELGLEALAAAGAPRPIAFRAGNYGANNETLRALANLGVTYDSTYNHPYLHDGCSIKTSAPLNRPTEVDGVIEVPITYFEDYPGHTRALQLCAASMPEFDAILLQSVAQRRPTAVIVSHSFELLNQKRTRANRFLLRRFDDYCARLESSSLALVSANFGDLKLRVGDPFGPALEPLKSNALRTVFRILEQAVGAYRYDRA